MNTKLLYSRPAQSFQDAMPLGNGRLGAMVFGRPLRREDYYSERIVLNEESLWYGGENARENPDSANALAEVRRLLLEGRVKEAEYLADSSMTAAPRNGTPYQMLGELVFTARVEHEPVLNYRRELDLETGIATVCYETYGGLFTLRAFCSAVDGVLVIELSTDSKAGLDFHVYLRRRPFDGQSFREGRPEVGIAGQAGPDGVKFAAALRGDCEHGSIGVSGQSLVFEKVASARLLVAASTTWREPDPRSACLAALSKASKRSMGDLRSRHTRDFSTQFQSVSLRLGKETKGDTDERLQAVRKGKSDSCLAALQFQFGRYLMISASRPGSLPATLQGIWCDSMTPIWNCNYTLNVNLQMTYWPAETTGLPRCHEPLFDFLDRLVERGRVTARRMYGCRGFVAHHTSDLRADPSPTGGVYASALWPLGGAWLALHVWEHYLFGRDLGFLRAKAYPILREAGRFFEDYLAENKRGQLVVAPSVSPENWFVLPDGERGKLCAGATMDSQILRGLFEALLEASEALGVDAKQRNTWRRILEKLPPSEIDATGRIREWVEPYAELDPGHRHLSHLYAVFPGSQISPLNDDGSLAKAARKGLQVKLQAATDLTGWNQAWMANMFARLLDAESAWACLQRIQQKFTHQSLLGDCPPLNLDGNFGFTSAVAEMLVQSHRGEIHILPALPKAWPEGEVRGLRARGGFTVSIAWKNGTATRVEVQSSLGGSIRLRSSVKLEGSAISGTAAKDKNGWIQELEIPAKKIVVLKRHVLRG